MLCGCRVRWRRGQRCGWRGRPRGGRSRRSGRCGTPPRVVGRNLAATASSWRMCPKVNARSQRLQRRGRVRTGEQPAHPVRAKHHHVVDLICFRHHPSEQQGALHPAFALVGRHRQVLSGLLAQPGWPANAKTVDQCAEDTTSARRRPSRCAPQYVRVASQRCPSGLCRLVPSQVAISRRQGMPRFTAAQPLRRDPVIARSGSTRR